MFKKGKNLEISSRTLMKNKDVKILKNKILQLYNSIKGLVYYYY